MAPKFDTRPDRRVARLASRQRNVLHLGEFAACGLSADAVRDRAERGWLHRVHQGVYAVGSAHLTLEGRFLAAVKACGPGALLSHYAAGALYRFVAWDGRAIDITVPSSSASQHRGIKPHRTCVLDRPDIRREKGIPVTSPARTLVDLAAILDPRALRRAVREAFALKRVRHGQLVETMQRLGPRRGIVALREILADGPAPTRSELEDVILALILDGGLERPDVNVPLNIGGQVVVPDFRWPEQRLVVEADGAAWHDHKLAREDDARRQALLEAHGERVLRVTWDQGVRQSAQTLARLRAAGVPDAT